MADDRALNDESRERLIRIAGGLSVDELATIVHDQWTVAAKLAHVAFWDRFVPARLRRWERGLEYQIDGPPWYDDLLNDSMLPEWLAVPPREAVKLVLDAANTLDTFLHALNGEAVARLEAEAGWMLRRYSHRREHLDEIEQALASA